MTILHRATMRIAALALAGVMASSLLSCTQDTREQAFARLPDWRGIWLSDDGIMTRIGLTNDPEGSGPGMFDRILNGLPPYKPGSPYDAAFRALQSANRSNASPPTGIKGCLFYFPGTMEGPRDFEALITPKFATFSPTVGRTRQQMISGPLRGAIRLGIGKATLSSLTPSRWRRTPLRFLPS
jgi:hypothetical protein